MVRASLASIGTKVAYYRSKPPRGANSNEEKTRGSQEIDQETEEEQENAEHADSEGIY
jgi:hypothetical protein